ncbi:GSCFA domain-containing protein [Methylobacterium terricola]|uniref:GSCFA domain-containing protein n=1 Tax=Methylobacterium terricola TaxID=2583531 RepID=A0A5C4LHX6_9HYPH|nr:GSCFA domain-containing protein [Methylobacterium terricola]TNC12755.1 GSCFA domain-containing protein [Methylobacterium terricola]
MKHPYEQAPPYTKWRHAVAAPATEAVDPGIGFPFRLSRRDRVATAGSCFAQHVGRALRGRGFSHYVTETAHPFVANVAGPFAYEQFSARYGNVYTSRQMLQLVQRALGLFEPADRAWTGPDGHWYDPFRPTVQPGGFLSVEELETDRRRHLACVRTLLDGLDYLVFTLGLTEAWMSATDGAAYPLCPGVAAGAFDPAQHLFVNLEVDEIVADVEAFLALITAINPSARLILTVSPVALAATAENRHVLASNTYSKAVLRVAAEMLARRNPGTIGYFPSYEIITGIHSRGGYVLDDLRSVSEAGVAQVMASFARNATRADEPDPADAPAPHDPVALRQAALFKDLSGLTAAECDEAMLGA